MKVSTTQRKPPCILGILGVLEHHPRMRPGTRPIPHFILGYILEASWSFFSALGWLVLMGPKMNPLMNYTCLFTNMTHPHIFNTLPHSHLPKHPCTLCRGLLPIINNSNPVTTQNLPSCRLHQDHHLHCPGWLPAGTCGSAWVSSFPRRARSPTIMWHANYVGLFQYICSSIIEWRSIVVFTWVEPSYFLFLSDLLFLGRT